MNLREIRLQKGLTQTGLSKLSGVHRVSINLYESGKKKPSIDSLKRLSAALGVTIDELVKQKAG